MTGELLLNTGINLVVGLALLLVALLHAAVSRRTGEAGQLPTRRCTKPSARRAPRCSSPKSASSAARAPRWTPSRRWDRPGLGRIGPHEFIGPAERTGLIGPLGNLILTLACHQIAEWRETFGSIVPVAVNVSPPQLLDPMPDADADAIAVVKAICDLVAVPHLDVVAESVETAAHAAAAVDAGCNVLQGFPYARPLEPVEAARWLQERERRG